MVSITGADRQDFLRMAEQHFRELNAAFTPQDDWKREYLDRMVGNPRLFPRWIHAGSVRAGFVIYGLEDHRFLPRVTGMIYELYVLPEFRRKGIARECAIQAIQQLKEHSPTKIQLEVVEGNKAAYALWESLGFRAVSQRLVLTKITA